MRIAAIVMENHVNAVYRTWTPMQRLAERGHAVHIEEREVIAEPGRLLDFDVVHICRCCFERMERLATQLRRAGVAVVWDNDEDLAAINRGMPSYRAFGGLRGQQIFASMVRMMRIADVVTVASDTLAERYEAASRADVRVMENYLPSLFARPQRVLPHEGIVIGWHAGGEHDGDADQMRVAELLEHVLRRHQHVRVVTIGVALKVPSRRYVHLPWMPYEMLPQHLSTFDIGIAPLADTAFNRARSNVKLKEYAAIGVPWLASPVGAYAGLGEQQGGRLVPDGHWRAELEELIVDAEERRRLGYRGRQWAEGERIDRHVDRWESVLADAVSRAAAVRR